MLNNSAFSSRIPSSEIFFIFRRKILHNVSFIRCIIFSRFLQYFEWCCFNKIHIITAISQKRKQRLFLPFPLDGFSINGLFLAEIMEEVYLQIVSPLYKAARPTRKNFRISVLHTLAKGSSMPAHMRPKLQKFFLAGLQSFKGVENH